MKSLAIIIFILISFTLVQAQQLTNAQIDSNICNLLWLKIDYEKYKSFKNTSKTDSAAALYKKQVNKIKNSPEIYLDYIQNEIKNNLPRLEAEDLPYKHGHNLHFTSDSGGFYIKKIDLYKVVQYSLFKKNEDTLPQNFHNIPVVSQESYRKKYKALPGERRAAIKFLKTNISLNIAEKGFIQSKRIEEKTVVDMKKYLDEYGLNEGNKQFIKWAIGYLMENPNLKPDISRLDNIYLLIKLQNYRPGDKDPSQR